MNAVVPHPDPNNWYVCMALSLLDKSSWIKSSEWYNSLLIDTTAYAYISNWVMAMMFIERNLYFLAYTNRLYFIPSSSHGHNSNVSLHSLVFSCGEHSSFVCSMFSQMCAHDNNVSSRMIGASRQTFEADLLLLFRCSIGQVTNKQKTKNHHIKLPLCKNGNRAVVPIFSWTNKIYGRITVMDS